MISPTNKIITAFGRRGAQDPHRSGRRDRLVALGLLLTMVVTRGDHFGGRFELPDASTAVFFLLGFLSRSPLWPAVAMILAAAVDAIVIAGGVCDFCVTPAYVFLIPTYATLWVVGRLARRRVAGLRSSEPSWRIREFATILLAAAIAALVAFLISSGSFYFFSGQFPHLPFTSYSRVVLTQYLPPYVGYCLMYVSAGAAVSCAYALPGAAWPARARRSIP